MPRARSAAAPAPAADADAARPNAAPLGRHEERRADRPVADLAGDRQSAEQRGEQGAEELPPAEHHQMLRARVEVLCRETQAVQDRGEQDQAEHAHQ